MVPPLSVTPVPLAFSAMMHPGSSAARLELGVCARADSQLARGDPAPATGASGTVVVTVTSTALFPSPLGDATTEGVTWLVAIPVERRNPVDRGGQGGGGVVGISAQAHRCKPLGPPPAAYPRAPAGASPELGHQTGHRDQDGHQHGSKDADGTTIIETATETALARHTLASLLRHDREIGLRFDEPDCHVRFPGLHQGEFSGRRYRIRFTAERVASNGRHRARVGDLAPQLRRNQFSREQAPIAQTNAQ